MYLLTASERLEFIAVDVVGPFSETVQGYLYILVFTRCYSKLARAFPTLRATATHVANVFLNHWLVSYGIPTYLLTDYKIQFVARFFATVYVLLGEKHWTTTAYHLQANGQA